MNDAYNIEKTRQIAIGLSAWDSWEYDGLSNHKHPDDYQAQIKSYAGGYSAGEIIRNTKVEHGHLRQVNTRHLPSQIVKWLMVWNFFEGWKTQDNPATRVHMQKILILIH